MYRSLIVLILAATLSGCAHDVAGPRSGLEGLPAGLDVELTVTPNVVDQHEPFVATLRVTNTTSQEIRIVTSHGCLVLPHVLLDDKRVPFKGSAWGCTAAITTHTFAPGETKTREWAMRAELYAQNQGDVEGAPAPKGVYRVLAEFDTPPADATGRKPAVEAALRVR